jgi:hypothetical protein
MKPAPPASPATPLGIIRNPTEKELGSPGQATAQFKLKTSAEIVSATKKK